MPIRSASEPEQAAAQGAGSNAHDGEGSIEREAVDEAEEQCGRRSNEEASAEIGRQLRAPSAQAPMTATTRLASVIEARRIRSMRVSAFLLVRWIRRQIWKIVTIRAADEPEGEACRQPCARADH